MTLRYVVADVFTDVPLEGNPVAVFLDAAGLDVTTMQRTARELNLSETVFVLAREGTEAEIRIFTPTVELPFAGHPVLGTAFVLAADDPGAELVRLTMGVGVIPVALTRQGGAITFGEMEQPLPQVEPFAHADELLEILEVERSVLPVEIYTNGPRHVYVTLDGPDAVAALTPDLRRLAGLGEFGVTCLALDGDRVKSRMFGPALGVPEDPATGSAAGPLAVHLVRHELVRPGATVEIRQGEEIGRPSRLYATAEGTTQRIDRVLVGGSAVVVARGEYDLPPSIRA